MKRQPLETTKILRSRHEENEFVLEAFKDLNDDKDGDIDETSSNESVEYEPHDDSEGEESSDEAPDDVSFNESRQTALQTIRDAIATVRAAKHEKKQRRRKMDEMLKEQKRQKIARLEDSRLPDALLEKLSDNTEPGVTASSEHGGEGEESDESENQPECGGDLGESGDDFSDEGSLHDEDFLSLDANDEKSNGATVTAMTLRESDRLANSRDRAEAFRQRRLYDSGIARHSSKSMLARQTKSRFVQDR